MELLEWLVFFTAVGICLALDLGMISKSSGEVSKRDALCMITLCVTLAGLFYCFLYHNHGYEKSMLFLTGYVLELVLSIDNVFIFILLFNNFKVQAAAQHKILMIGIISAIIMRFCMISGGIYLVNKFEMIFYVFGIFLIYSGIKILITSDNDDKTDYRNNIVFRMMTKILPFTSESTNNQLWIRHKKKIYFTELFIVLLLIEKVDLIFALDSIPAILAITSDVFIVFTSNIFAIICLRSMYFFLSHMMNKFTYLKYALSLILSFIGCKMILALMNYSMPLLASLLVIFFSITAAVILSIMFPKQQSNHEIKNDL